ncbi:MAG: hypothetical protein H7061_06760 [Bdellovibrionaceae bacterium]|nr:hypothetical protein [Bdellovibrio sp.]
MKITTRSQQGALRLPATQISNLLDGQMTLFLRPWGSQDFNQKFIDEVTHYLSSAQADIDVTSPFDFHENLTSLSNKTRIAMLLAHDYFLKVENVNEFSVGFEATIFFHAKNELAWSSVGRFGLKKIQGENVNTLFEAGVDRDDETLLPVQLVGIEKEIEIQSGSLIFNADIQLLLYSTYQGEISTRPNGSDPLVIDAKNSECIYWYSLINAD